MDKQTYSSQVKERALSAKPGTVFIAADFNDIAARSLISSTLSKLCRQHKLRRVRHGVYELPEYSEFLGEYIDPDPYKAIEKLSSTSGKRIIPCGANALNLLGLSDQVPAVRTYVTDGSSRECVIGGCSIKILRSTDKNIKNLSEKSALVVYALKAIGAERINSSIAQRISFLLTSAEKSALKSETQGYAAWIRSAVNRICSAEGNG